MKERSATAAVSTRPAGSLLGLAQSAFDPASRVRLIQFLPYLAEMGWEVTFRPNSPDRQWQSPLRNRLARGVHQRAARALMKANRLRDVRGAGPYDVVFVNRDLAGGGMFFERQLWKANPRVVFDFDDAIYLGKKNEGLVRWMCENAAWVTPGNDYLADWARQYNPRTTVIPTVIDTDRYTPRSWTEPDRKRLVRVGWTGSDSSIGATLFPYLEMFANLQREIDFELVIITNSRPSISVNGLRWSFIPWTAEGEGRLGEFFDVGIMPLVDDEFQRGKCGLKLLQCMAAGLPTIASPVGVNARITQQGATGFSARTPEDWRGAVHALVESHELRASMGQAGRLRCEEDYSIRRWLPELVRIFDQVRGRA